MSRFGTKPGARSATGGPTGGRAARHRAALVGVLSLLALCIQLVLAAPAGAVPFTGGFSPMIIGGKADLNGDGVVNGRDDSNNFFGQTEIVDGGLDCEDWIGENDIFGGFPRGDEGDGSIGTDDDCQLRGYDGSMNGVLITVSGGEFQVANGRLPTVYNALDPDDPSVNTADFAWQAIDGKVDSDRANGVINAFDCRFGLIGETVDVGLGDVRDGADILGNDGFNFPCFFMPAPAVANNGFVDLNSDTLITALGDSCAGCFFGLEVAAGLVQAPGPGAITLDPPTAENSVGSSHTVTATVLDQNADPVPGADVHFAVTGDGTPVPASGDGVTDAAGQATFTFSNDTEGTNTITACVDADAGSDCDAGELTATATKTWSTEPVCIPGDPRNQVVGTSAGEVLTGTPGRDVICGRGGNDVLRGLGGNDLILGGGGADRAFGGPGRDTIRGGRGNDRLFGQGGRDALFGQRGNDLLNGGRGNDRCSGGPGNDTLRNC